MFITITVILCITAIELYALHLGINGVMLAAVIAILAGIAGFEVKPLIQLLRPKKNS